MNAVPLRHALRFAFHRHRTSGRRDDRPPSFSDLLQELRTFKELGIIDLVRTAGLHPVPVRPSSRAVVLLPGSLVSRVVRRALDLGLQVNHRTARLHPLFMPARLP